MVKNNTTNESFNQHYDKTNNSNDLNKIIKHQHKVWNQPMYDYYNKLKQTVTRDTQKLKCNTELDNNNQDITKT